MSDVKRKSCEAITARFAWADQRCGEPAVAEAEDVTWGTMHAVCAEHDPARKGGAA